MLFSATYPPHVLKLAGEFLTDPQMRGTGMGIGYSLVFAGRLDEIEHGLKLTDITHVTVNVNQVFF